MFQPQTAITSVEKCALGPVALGSALVRDSKQAGDGPVVSFSAEAWQSFMAAVKAGDFDLRG
ncbi:hypothetical protein Cs7R123_33600 [Catellatospora sp. TT07R-123]|uniref:DUF397 domain-containing protein n=1 Tax=Catellatospora sp. TT07R-123 TaxID=2733863 RepID=UPI001B1705D9|nr:DUF397 domain-containing protein [Catellatospora sp. TT07R-123]GHJ46018.1 hypothetical protein Cs7R123_33600 [Catellatospora sp. TT07R-123]